MAGRPADESLLSAKSTRVQAAGRLARRASRADARLFLAEGPQAVREALGLSGCVVEVFALPEASRTHPEIRAAAHDSGIAWLLVAEAALSKLTQTVHPQGVVAVCRFVDRPLAELLAGAQSYDGRTAHKSLLVVCADVRDPGNAGAVMRCADAAGAVGVVLTGRSVDPYNGKVVRASAGSLFHLPLAIEPDTAAVVGALRGRGFTVLAGDGAGELDLDDAIDSGILTRPTAWLFGNEAWGLADAVAGLADHRVAVPIHGRAESLNLATAAAVCLYASARAHR